MKKIASPVWLGSMALASAIAAVPSLSAQVRIPDVPPVVPRVPPIVIPQVPPLPSAAPVPSVNPVPYTPTPDPREHSEGGHHPESEDSTPTPVPSPPATISPLPSSTPGR